MTDAVTVDTRGELSAWIEADIPADDFDLAIYDHTKQKVASGGMPATPPAGLESVNTTAKAGLYYVVVQPYIATRDISTSTLTVALS